MYKSIRHYDRVNRLKSREAKEIRNKIIAGLVMFVAMVALGTITLYVNL